jgi:molybdopterin-containing oxidoreductase family membrane subunit
MDFISYWLGFAMESIFNGFALYSLVYLVFFNSRNITGFNRSYDQAACLLLQLASVIALAWFIVELTMESFRVLSDVDSYAIRNRMLGPYWWAFWIPSISYYALPHLLRFSSIKTNRIIRLLLACWILISLHLDWIILLIVSYHRDFVKSSWVMYYPASLEFLLKIVLFSLLVWIVKQFNDKKTPARA